MKTNKTYTKRLRKTKSGKILARKLGVNHYNAKEDRESQLRKRTPNKFDITNKAKSRFMPGKSGR